MSIFTSESTKQAVALHSLKWSEYSFLSSTQWILMEWLLCASTVLSSDTSRKQSRYNSLFLGSLPASGIFSSSYLWWTEEQIPVHLNPIHQLSFTIFWRTEEQLSIHINSSHRASWTCFVNALWHLLWEWGKQVVEGAFLGCLSQCSPEKTKWAL